MYRKPTELTAAERHDIVARLGTDEPLAEIAVHYNLHVGSLRGMLLRASGLPSYDREKVLAALQNGYQAGEVVRLVDFRAEFTFEKVDETDPTHAYVLHNSWGRWRFPVNELRRKSADLNF